MGSTFAKEKPAKGAKFLREPGRANLTDPPNGYRTPSPDQPYGLNYRHDKPKALSPEDRQTKGAELNDAFRFASPRRLKPQTGSSVRPENHRLWHHFC